MRPPPQHQRVLLVPPPPSVPATFPAIVVVVEVIVILVLADPPRNAITIAIANTITIVAHRGLFALIGVFFLACVTLYNMRSPC